MVSVRDMKIAEALLVLLLAYHIIKFEIVEIIAFTYHEYIFVFSVMAGWIAGILFILFFDYTAV